MSRRGRNHGSKYQAMYISTQLLLDILQPLLGGWDIVWDEEHDEKNIKPMLKRLNVEEEKLNETD